MEEQLMRNKKGWKDVVTLTGCKDLSKKHPISALIELSTKRKWGNPIYDKVFECGQPHNRQYIFKVGRSSEWCLGMLLEDVLFQVNVNGRDFETTVAAESKKKAKANAATAALRSLGLLPCDPSNPL